MNLRIKKLRKSLGLNQSEFGARLGLKTSTVSGIELSTSPATEQTIKSICREFGVSESWLRTGIGEMFVAPATADLVDQLAQQFGLDYVGTELLRTYLSLDDQSKAVVSRFVMQLTANVQRAEDDMQSAAGSAPADSAEDAG